MRYRYKIMVDGKKELVDQGSSLARNYEEALDGGSIKLILKGLKDKIRQFSKVEITIYEVEDDGVTVINERFFEYLVISDVVETTSKYGYYEHNLTVIEYTEKLSVYITNTFAFSKNIENIKKAPYEYVLNVPPIENINGVDYYPDGGFETSANDGYYVDYTKRILIEPLNLKETMKQKIIFNKVDTGIRVGLDANFPPPSAPEIKTSIDIYIETNAPISNNRHMISQSGVTWSLPLGNWEITLGFYQNGKYYPYFKYYVNIISEYGETLYDVVMNIRDLISVYGGIESKIYFEHTRLFELNEDDANYLKTIESPQIFMPTSNLQQLLRFVLSYVNALPRIIKKDDYDELQLEYYGKINGEYDKKGATEIYSEQNTNQIGTRSYAELHNILPNDLNNATTYKPYQNGFQNVRANGIQLTDADGFELQLPKDKPLYKPVKLEVSLPYDYSVMQDSYEFPQPKFEVIESGELVVDISELLINSSEWALKQISSNFPNVYYTGIFSTGIGMNIYKTENFEWVQGSTSIQLGQINGVMFKSSLMESVLKYAINKYVTENIPPKPNIPENYTTRYQLLIKSITKNAMWFKDIKFNLEYITNENLVIKQDKEDLSEISFYSEIRHNQSENTINLSMAGSRIYGDLQRTGNKSSSFTKYHRSLNEIHEVGTIDKDGEVIVNVQLRLFNDYIVATYTTIKNYNRISQATFIDQTYRWRDNYASEIRNRHETYNDYIMLVPRNKQHNVDNFSSITKIVHKKKSGQSDDVPYFHKTLLGILGVNEQFIDTKATIGLVRTDGTISEYKDDGSYKFVSVPISSAGYQGGLIFKIGFLDNQVAGDGLIQRDGNWYNQAVKYTDKEARVKFLDFYILNQVPEINNVDDYPIYDLGSNEIDVVNENSVATNNNLIYFSTGDVNLMENAVDSLIVNKDPLSNFNLNYSLNIMSYYYGLFIIGKSFYDRNYLVNNNFLNNETYLYTYINGEYYNLFENMTIKDGYNNKINITGTNVVQLEIINEVVVLKINGLNNNITSWALGDKNGKLYLASNENIDEISLIEMHIRPKVDIIGGHKDFDVRLHRLKTISNIVIDVEHSYSISNLNLEEKIDLISDVRAMPTQIMKSSSSLLIEADTSISIYGSSYDANINIICGFYNIDAERIDVASDLIIEVEINNSINGVNYDVDTEIYSGFKNVDTNTTNINSSLELLVGYSNNDYNFNNLLANNCIVSGFGNTRHRYIETGSILNIETNYVFGDVNRSYSTTSNIISGSNIKVVPTPPNVFVSYSVMGSQVRWDMRVYNFNDYPTAVLYSTSADGNYINGGIVQANSGKDINAFRYTNADTPITVYAYARLRNSQGNLSDIACGSRFYTPTQATWQYNGSSSSSFCFADQNKWIGTPCSNVGETMVIHGANEGYGDRCIELICKI